MSLLIHTLRRLVEIGGGLLWAVGLSACTYQGHIDEPVTVKATWYSYLAGDDIRQTCVPNGLPRYRLVYNGRYEEQLRSYDLVKDHEELFISIITIKYLFHLSISCFLANIWANKKNPAVRATQVTGKRMRHAGLSRSEAVSLALTVRGL